MKYLTLIAVALLFASALNAQNIRKTKSDTLFNTYNKDFVVHVKKAHSDIHIDGIVNEPDWKAAEPATNFFRVLPMDTGYAKQQSEVKLTYDDQALYMAVIFHDTIPGDRIMESFRRDFTFGNNDNFLVFFDTFLDQTNGFSFGFSASGAKWDGTMSDGSRVNLDWDAKWESETKHYEDKWITEIRIPFKSIRYPSGAERWNVNFSRLDLKTNEKSAWAPVPRQFPTASLAYTGMMKFEEPLPKSKPQISFIPYIYGGYLKNFEAGTDAEYKRDFGFDVKLGISSSMNLDLTYNPDFAQVEVDQQVMNLDRFELFFPEKRQFFLENSDLFAGYGYNTVTPFFSRRIGLDAPVLAGARLSGKLGNDWRIGFMNMTTQKTSNFLARNFTVASVQKKVFARSNFGLILVNKEYFDQPQDTNMFNRVAGFDYNLASKNNFWNGKFFYHRSFQPENPDKQYAQGATVRYKTKHVQAGVSQTSVGENYLAEAGYVRRTGYNFLGPEIGYLFVPNKKVVSHGLNLESENYFDPEYRKIEQKNTLKYGFEFQNRSNLEIGYEDNFVKLENDFDPTHISDTYLPKGSEYNFDYWYIVYTSTPKTLFNWATEFSQGTFFNGDIKFLSGRVGYRHQPYINFVLNFTYTDLILPGGFKPAKFWLLGPKLDVTFTDDIFLSTFVQYNEQIDNMNINMRFQWRYQPVSDIYIVYTDNYIPGSWTSKNRAIVLKMTYWLN